MVYRKHILFLTQNQKNKHIKKELKQKRKKN